MDKIDEELLELVRGINEKLLMEMVDDIECTRETSVFELLRQYKRKLRQYRKVHGLEVKSRVS